MPEVELGDASSVFFCALVSSHCLVVFDSMACLFLLVMISFFDMIFVSMPTVVQDVGRIHLGGELD